MGDACECGSVNLGRLAEIIDGRCSMCGLPPCAPYEPYERLTEAEARAIVAMGVVYEGADTAGEPTSIGAGNDDAWYALVAEARARLGHG